MKEFLKKTVVGTPLEPLARKVHLSFKTARAVVAGRVKRHKDEKLAKEKSRLYDMQTVEIMRRVLREDSNCADVGCSEGKVLRKILRFAPNGTHFAFEPLPLMYQGLLDAFGHLPNVHIYDYALSDTAGSRPFQHVVTNHWYSGFRQRKYARPHEQIEEITVQSNLLDNLIPKDTPIRLIKVDVEGAELEVFKGALETIKNNRPVIVFEHGLGAADYYGTTPEDIYDLLTVQGGLKLYVLTDWLESGGRGFLDRDAFCGQFYRGLNFYFMAAPADGSASPR